MGITVEHMEDSTTLGLEGTIDIASAAELKTALQGALGAKQPVRVSLAAEVALDVTAIQLLWAAEREAGASRVEFRLDGQLPATVSSALKEAGFERFPVPE